MFVCLQMIDELESGGHIGYWVYEMCNSLLLRLDQQEFILDELSLV